MCQAVEETKELQNCGAQDMGGPGAGDLKSTGADELMS